MKELRRIPIRNIYYMLCYAWNRLEERHQQPVDQEEAQSIYDLLARVLVVQVSAMIKKGMYKEYMPFNEESSTLRGKLDFPSSVRALSHLRGKMFIHYDELSNNLIHNRIVKSTIHYLLRNQNLNSSLKEQLMVLYSHFQEVSLMRLEEAVFQKAGIHRHNRHYGFVLQICKLIFQGLLINEENGTNRFSDFERDHYRMAELFESFVRNFYGKEIPGYRVSREIIRWDEESGENDGYLPKMETDISLENEHVKWIIDTKYSYQTLAAGRFDTDKLKSANLYQLYSYLRNSEKRYVNKPLKGALLYPWVDHSLSLKYRLSGHEVRVYTVDLSQSWKVIHERLLEVVK
ncbi:5-methylcytosine-specific restriction endonuclease system specificity protein McrC [Cohnella lubricantis]|uniref:5-methylcytosine-specific restriction endonuclease system specificity protein McrC n=1 Tax=Cohnella lubricantis TaxID=2163172 RepID=A0A841T6X4_9BACL|nr:5-methylcytosine-specific restriction endonuclease system specificity protein McrC [Cohnella lubricantis]MBB6675796.1 5-methylcytosine-specific restriction endonuclease system specificity protein McrC [Cohnella lubricantis]MBP2119871.1 5-methylcytosine-specific restriction enzyme subunit McrC [Cohnella lubricantis]